MLELLDQQQDNPVKLTLSDGEVVLCKPIQYLEEDYESYLVQVLESSKSYIKGEYLEVEEQDIKAIN